MSGVTAAYSIAQERPIAPREDVVNIIRVDQKELSPPPRPPVEISISSGSPGDQTAVERVQSLLYDVKELTERAFLISKIDWNEVSKVIGAERAAENRRDLTASFGRSQSELRQRLDASGITVLRPDSSSAPPYSNIPGYVAIDKFSFQEGGSLYKITTDSSGSVVGTKDDRPWRIWEGLSELISNTGAATALDVLSKSFTSDKTGNFLELNA